MWDAHTHTHYCPHGSGDHVEEMIQRAIELGFTTYSITEHSPLPKGFIEKIAPKEVVETITMAESELDRYIKEMYELKQKYKSDIRILVGLEVDYLPGYSDWTTHLLQDCGKYLEDSILSVHFMHGKDGIRCIDYSREDVEDGLVSHYGSFYAMQQAYYEEIHTAIEVDLGIYKPKRLGHLTLCHKFQHYLKGNILIEEEPHTINNILQKVKAANMSLDVNTAGLFKEDCREIYPPITVINQAKKLEIPLVFGSDAHRIQEVGRAYEAFLI